MSKGNCNKDAVISQLKREKIELEAQVNELKCMVHEFQETNRLMDKQISDMCKLIEQNTARECGCVTICNHTCYQDFIGILIDNGYIVEVEPSCDRQSLKITIKEGQVK